jgi:retron-type reverse transcriptase
MKGRKIEDQVKQLKHLLDYADAVEENRIVVALDQEKAYDRIDHDYLLAVLKHMRFPDKFRNLVKILYTEAQTQVIVKGEMSEPFVVIRGVRQGDPLSCLLFNLAIEPLACMLRNSDLTGIKVPGTDRRLLVSLFADDTTIYLASTDSWSTLWQVIDLWCTASTAKFNTKKTIILPFGSPEYRHRLTSTHHFWLKINMNGRHRLYSTLRAQKCQIHKHTGLYLTSGQDPSVARILVIDSTRMEWI